MNKILFPMVDGGIINYEDDTRYIPGCETCDYGSEYINDITITLTKHNIHAVLNEMYDYAISEGDMLKLLLPAYEEIKSMTENQFSHWFKEQLFKLMKEYDRYCRCEDVLREYDVQEIAGGASK